MNLYLYQLVRQLTAWIATATLLGLGSAAWADPPSRVARLAYISGAVSFSPAGENDWSEATINRPLGNGDRLWADDRARVEIQTNGSTLRMDGNTSVAVVNLDDRMTQLQLTQGRLLVRVRRLGANQVVEIDTPNLAFTVRRPGEYHISVDPRANATDIAVRSGSGDAAGDGAAYRIDKRQALRFYGTGLREYQSLAITRPDAFEVWSASRERQVDRSVAARYVSPDVLGYQDLDAHGSWRRDPTYGNVWVPQRVAADWTPYRDGHWSWVDPWGWTWIDDAPWGFAVSHYGRWTNNQGTWAWVPGPVRQRATYAPAVVGFVGGNNLQVPSSSGNVGGVAWFPLAPREVYRPSYPVSRAYFENLNRSNTVVHTEVINNTYNVSNVSNVVYVNQRVAGAVTAVPTTVFVQAQPVARSALRVTPEVMASAPVTALAAVVPTERSVRGGAAPGNRPPGRVFERPVVASTAAPAPLAGLVAQLAQLAKQPGKPLDNAARKALVGATAVPAAAVTVVAAVPAIVAPAASSPAVTASAAASPTTPARPTAGASATAAAPAAAASRAVPPTAAVVPAPVAAASAAPAVRAPAAAASRAVPPTAAVAPAPVAAASAAPVVRAPAAAASRAVPAPAAVAPSPVAAASAAPVVRAPAVTVTPAPPASAAPAQRATIPVAPPAALPAPVAGPPPAPAVAPRAVASQPALRASEPAAPASRPLATPPRLLPSQPGPATPVAPASAPAPARVVVPAGAASAAQAQRPTPAASATDRSNRPAPGASNPRSGDGARERRKPAGDTP